MRKDMAKVIVERPRLGSRANNDDKGALKRLQRAVGNDDLLPKRASTARGRRSSAKCAQDVAGTGRLGVVDGCSVLGFRWFVIGERSRKMAIARDSPP